MAMDSMRTRYIVDDDQHPSLGELLALYGYLLKQLNGYLWLSGFLRRSSLQHARSILEQGSCDASQAQEQPELQWVAMEVA